MTFSRGELSLQTFGKYTESGFRLLRERVIMLSGPVRHFDLTGFTRLMSA